MFTSKMNMDRYKRLREERDRLGLPVEPLNIKICDHPLIGRKLLSRSTNIIYTIKAVHKRYNCGWYFAIVIKSETAIGMRCWANINSFDKYVLDQIYRSDVDFELLKEVE